MRVVWSDERDRQLREIYALHSASRRAGALRRLAKDMNIAVRRCHDRARSLGCQRGYRKFSEAERLRIKALSRHIRTDVIASRLGRSYWSVAQEIARQRRSALVKARGYKRVDLAVYLGIDVRTLAVKLTMYPINADLFDVMHERDVARWVWEHWSELEIAKINTTWLREILQLLMEEKAA